MPTVCRQVAGSVTARSMQWATSAREMDSPRAHAMADGRPVPAGQRPVGQPHRPHRGPLQVTAAQHVLHLGQVGVAAAERRAQDGIGQAGQDESVARVAAGRVRARGRSHRADRRGAHHHDPAHSGRVHDLGDGPGAVPGHPGFGLRAGTQAGQDRVGSLNGAQQDGRVRGGQVGGHHPRGGDREPSRVPDHGGHLVAGRESLLEHLLSDTARRRDHGELHLLSPSPGCAVISIDRSQH